MITKSGSKFYVISGILGNFKDISPNMIEKILHSSILFVEFIDEVELCFQSLNINYTGKLIEIDKRKHTENKRILIGSLLNNQNIGIFEIGGTACFMDPGYILVDLVYELGIKMNIDFEIIPIPGTSALMTAISVSGFNMDKFTFGGFFYDYSVFEVENTKLPMVYFTEFSDPIEILLENLTFMKGVKNRSCFFGINLGKLYSKDSANMSNVIFRGTFDEVYYKFVNFTLCNADNHFEQVLIFNK